MENSEYLKMIEEAKSIPCVEVGELVVTDFRYINREPTGKCCDHTDNKWGNFKFRTKYNRVKCYSCHKTWNNIDLVKDYKRMEFNDAILFLYHHFPKYFSVVPFENKGNYVPEEWDGLSNTEYRFLKIPTRLFVKDKMIFIRDFAKEFSYEHDILIAESILRAKDDIERIFVLQKNNPKAVQDRKDIYKRLFELLQRGIMNKELINGKEKVDLQELIKILEEMPRK